MENNRSVRLDCRDVENSAASHVLGALFTEYELETTLAEAKNRLDGNGDGRVDESDYESVNQKVISKGNKPLNRGVFKSCIDYINSLSEVSIDLTNSTVGLFISALGSRQYIPLEFKARASSADDEVVKILKGMGTVFGRSVVETTKISGQTVRGSIVVQQGKGCLKADFVVDSDGKILEIDANHSVGKIMELFGRARLEGSDYTFIPSE